MSGTIIGIANAFGASISPGAAQGSAPGPPPSQDPMNFYVTPYNSAGTSTPSGQYKLGLYSTGIYNFTVDWGDGNTDVITSYNQPEVTHDYGTVLPTDNFEITITPNSPIRQQAVNSWYFGNRNEGDGVKVRSIDQFGATLFYADQDIFYGCEVLSTFASTISNVPTILNKVIGDGFFFNCDELAPAFYTAYWVGPFTGTAESFNEGKSVAGLPVGNSRGKFQLDFTPTNMFRAFKNQAIFNQNDVGLYWDVSSCNNFTECFSSCLRYNQPFPNWTFLTGTPVFAADMFKNAVDFNQNITGWNTSAFQDMGGMFARTLPVGSGGVTDSVFNQAIGVWNTDNVRDASAMFFNAVNFNQDLSNWFSTGSLQNIGPSSGGIVSMFSGATSFNSSVANWDLTNPLLTSVSYVFNGATSFDQPLNSWDVSGVSFFVGTFNGATAFNQNLALWDVSSGLFFSEMFKGATSFVGTSLTSWNVSSATDMQDMFNGATSFTNSLVFWNPSSVTNMSGMFNGATLANPNVSGWNISSLANASDMFTNSGLSSFNYQALLVAWAAQAPNIQNGVTLSSINQYANFGAPADAKAKLVNDYGWTITDLVNPNLPPPALTFTIDTTATEVGSTANNQYRLPLISSGTYDFYVQWGDGDAEQITSWNQAEATHTYAAAGTYTVKMFAVAATTTPIIDHISWASQDGTTLSAANDRLKVQDISEWAAAILYLNEYVFTNCENLNITTTSSPTFGSKVLRTSAFENCDNLSGDLSGWGTVGSPITGLAGTFYKNSTSNPNFNFVLQHNVGSLIQPFQNCAAFNNPLNNWDVSSVIGFTAAFSGASAFNQDISGWDTGNSSAFNAMFSNALAFNQNISSWNVASVTTFSQMFQGATLFNQPVGAWTTTSLTNLFSTFKNAAAFDQDLANWDVSGVTTAVDMLTGSNISAANWDALLIGWAAQGTGAGSLQANVTLSNINQLHGSVDSAATAAYNKLTSAPYNWTIVDLGGVPVGNLLLDTSYGSGAEAAYSVRKLRTAYTGPAMKVQDTVGGATQDIYFDANNNLDEAAIISYGGSNDVFVETWYDQSINGNDATQGTSANRPKIYDGTTGALVKESGKVAIDFDGSNDNFDNSTVTLTSNDTLISVVSKIETTSTAVNIFDSSESNKFFLQIDASKNFQFSNGSGTNLNHKNDGFRYLTSLDFNGATLKSYFNGYNTKTATVSNQSRSGLRIGKHRESSAGWIDGTMQELIYWNQNKNANHTSIESNVGDYFTQNTPLLDTYTGAAAAYSLRKLSSSYSGSAIRVRRSSDNTEQDINFNVFGELDTVSLLDFAGAGDAFVKTWYSQTGSNDATQTATGSQPKIVSSGAVITENGKPAVQFDGSNDFVATSDFTAEAQPFYFSIVATPSATTLSRFIDTNGTDTNNRINITLSNGSIYEMNAGNSISGGTATTTQQLLTADFDTTNSFLYKDGVQIISGDAGTRNIDSVRIGANKNGIQSLNGTIQEVVFYNSDQSSNRTGIETNINTFYDIYTEPVAPLLLNNYPGAAAAYSLRRINSSYQGSAVLVQTALNTKGPVYIGFDSNNDLDTTSLATYGGSEDVVVAGWLDQSGNGNDASQATSANRPKIYDGTTGVVTENGKPALDFTNTVNLFLKNSSGQNLSISATDYSFIYVQKRASATGWIFDSQTGRFVISSGSPSGLFFDGAWKGSQQTTTAHEINYFDFVSPSSTNYYVNGSLNQGPLTYTQKAIGGLTAIGKEYSGSVPMNGTLQEFIIYTTPQTSYRTDIEENIGGYYDIPLAGLLDENPGAAAAYSLRRLSSTYTGSAIQVQRADNVGGTTDIGFDSYGELDTTALTTAAQGNDMVVATWYDQSGNSNDATQGTSANRPKIYDGTTGVVTENGKPAVDFGGGRLGLTSATSVTQTNMSLFAISKTSDVAQGFYNGFIFYARDNANSNYLILNANRDDRSISTLTKGISGSSNDLTFDNVANLTQNLKSGFIDSTTMEVFLNSTSEGTQSITNASSAYTSHSIGDYVAGGSVSFRGTIQEIVWYSSDQSSNRTDIEDNIGGYYDIPLAGLLDENPGAAAAYSLRRLSSTYTGSAIQVQRADNVGGTTDIGFDSYGELDTIALTTAAAGNDMVVATWYDQSGNSNDATQGTSTARPKIYDGTTGVVTENGKPALDFDGSNDYFEMPSPFSGTTPRSTFFTGYSTENPTSASVIYGANVQATNSGESYNITTEIGLRVNQYALWDDDYQGTSRKLLTTIWSSGNAFDAQMYLDGVQLSTSSGNSTVDLNTAAHSTSWIARTSYNPDNYLTAVFSEMIFYASDQSSNRTDIEENIGGYYDIPLAGLLDENPGAAAAYSLRRLSSTYTGSAIQVQRADNVGGTTDIGFDSYGDLDTTALTTAAAGNDMVVATWYDQSGNSNDASQATSANRPKIYDGSTGVVTENGKPALETDGANDYLSFTSMTFSSNFCFLNVQTTSLKDTGYGGAGGNFGAYFEDSTTLRWRFSGSQSDYTIPSQTSGTQYLAFINRASSSVELHFQGVSRGTTSNGGTSTLFDIMRGNAGGLYLNGHSQELIFWNSDQSSNRTDIEDNINTFYSIY